MTATVDPLAGLRAPFRAKSRERLRQMERCLAALDADSADRAALDRLTRHFHTLSGVAGIYGHPLVSELGDAGEIETRDFLNRGAPPDAAAVQRWRTLVERMREELVSS